MTPRFTRGAGTGAIKTLLPVSPDDAVADPGRLEELRATGLADVRSTPRFYALTSLAQRLLRVPVATISLVEEDHQHFISYTGGDGGPADGRTSMAHSFCRYTVATGERLSVTDARESPLLANSPAVTDDGWVAYSGAPLETSSGNVMGTLCALSTEPREWTEEDEQVLAELAEVAAAEIEYRLRSRTFAQVETLARELHEPVEVLGESIESLAGVADNGPGPRVGRLAAQARTRFGAVASIERQLFERVARRAAAHRASGAHLLEAVERAARLARVHGGEQAIEVVRQADRELLAPVDPHALQRALSHMLVAAMNHGSADRSARLTVSYEDGVARLMLLSAGCAMPVRVLTSVVSRLDAALRSDASVPRDEPHLRSVTMRGRSTVAQADGISAATGPGGLHLIVELAVEPAG